MSYHAYAIASALSATHAYSAYVTTGKAAAIAKSNKPKTEPFHTFKRRAIIWGELHCMEHLLTRPSAGDMSDFECHNVARRTILLALSVPDIDYSSDTTYLCTDLKLLLERLESSRDIEVRDLYQKLSVATQCGRIWRIMWQNMADHVNECMTYRCHYQVPGHACMCGCGALVALV